MTNRVGNKLPSHTEPIIGGLYFLMTFTDDTYARPIIRSCEYKGKVGDREFPHLFRFLDSDDEFVLSDDELGLALDLDSLIEELKDFRDGKLKSP